MNPFMMLMQAMQGGGNPLAFVQQQAANNPQFQQLHQIVGGKTPQEMRQIADNMLRQRGSSMEEVEKQMNVYARGGKT